MRRSTDGAKHQGGDVGPAASAAVAVVGVERRLRVQGSKVLIVFGQEGTPPRNDHGHRRYTGQQFKETVKGRSEDLLVVQKAASGRLHGLRLEARPTSVVVVVIVSIVVFVHCTC